MIGNPGDIFLSYSLVSIPEQLVLIGQLDGDFIVPVELDSGKSFFYGSKSSSSTFELLDEYTDEIDSIYLFSLPSAFIFCYFGLLLIGKIRFRGINVYTLY